MVSSNSSIGTMLCDSARGFLRRHGESLRQLDALAAPTMPQEIVDDVERLGWLNPIAPAGADRGDFDASMLADLVCCVAGTSPALASLVLTHHYASCVLRALPCPRANGWLALDPYAEPDHIDPNLRIEVTDRGAIRLTGEAHNVVGALHARHLLLTALKPEGTKALVTLDAARATISEPIPTLGFRGAGACDLRVAIDGESDPERFNGPFEIDCRFDEARAMLAPSAAALLLAVVVESNRVAEHFALTRIQGGRPIGEHDAIRRLLLRQRSALLACRTGHDACLAEPQAWLPALQLARQAACEGTDLGIQILGGAGYVSNSGAERWYRDARQASLLLGRSSVLAVPPKVRSSRPA